MNLPRNHLFLALISSSWVLLVSQCQLLNLSVNKLLNGCCINFINYFFGFELLFFTVFDFLYTLFPQRLRI